MYKKKHYRHIGNSTTELGMARFISSLPIMPLALFSIE